MKKVKQLNGWIIKKYSENEVSEDVFKEGRIYNIFSPANVFLEEKLTFAQAIEFAEENSDNVTTLRKAKLSKEEFLLFIEHGYWFVPKGLTSVIFIKYVKSEDIVVALFLDAFDPESMTISTFYKNDWEWDKEEQMFKYNASHIYHIGSTDCGEKYHIYNEEDMTVNDEKLFKQILESYENEHYFLLEKEQLKYLWSQLKANNISDLGFREIAIS